MRKLIEKVGLILSVLVLASIAQAEEWLEYQITSIDGAFTVLEYYSYNGPFPEAIGRAEVFFGDDTSGAPEFEFIITHGAGDDLYTDNPCGEELSIARGIQFKPLQISMPRLLSDISARELPNSEPSLTLISRS